MASLRRKPNSKYWIACFNLPNGKRAQRSTKTTNRKVAQKLADDYEAAARSRMTESQARRVINDLHRLISGGTIHAATVRGYLDHWLAARSGTISEATKSAYRATSQEFCDFLGDRADIEMLYVTTTDVAAFRDHLASTRAPSTANNRLKILRIAFRQAWRDGVIDDNPAAKVSILKVAHEDVARRAFTLKELQALLKAADNEWRGMILFGVYTGQRLGDIVRLRWDNIDLETDTIAFTTRKTRRRQILPVSMPLRQWLKDQRSTVNSAQIFPSLFARIGKTARVSALSNQFYDLMALVGLISPRSHQKMNDGLGRDGRRAQNQLSFHSLRHTVTSLMKNAGISPAIVQEFVGHDSKAVSQHYTHIELAALRQAANAIPSLEG